MKQIFTYWVLVDNTEHRNQYRVSMGKWSEAEAAHFDPAGFTWVCPAPDYCTAQQAARWLNAQVNS